MIKKFLKKIELTYFKKFIFYFLILIFEKNLQSEIQNIKLKPASTIENKKFKRNPFVYDLIKGNTIHCSGYAFVKNEKCLKACAFVTIDNLTRKVYVNDKIGDYTVKEIRPDGLIICAGNFCQKLVCFDK